MTTFAWHVHHELIVEPLTEPIKYRVAYIRENKRADEIGTRLRLFKPVKGKLPVSLVEAGEVYVKACNALIVAQEAHEETGKARFKAKMAAAKAWAEIARDKAWKAYNEAREAHDEAGKTHNKAWEARNNAGKAYDKVEKAAMPAILKLHTKECPDCPWDGKTIFPEAER